MKTTRWAILGPGDIGGWFARALPGSAHGTLHAVGSTNAERAAAFAATYGAPVTGTYEELLSRDDIDAVYISTVNTTHADLAVAALRAGKAVLCEKPVAPTVAEVERVLDQAAASGLPFVEAYKHRFGPFARALDAAVANREVGTSLQLVASFGFAAGQRSGRLFDPELAGGAILDVGGYPVSLAVALAAAAGVDPADLTVTVATGEVGDTGVDEHASATIAAAGFSAEAECSIVAELPRSARLSGSAGVIELADVFGSRSDSAASFLVRADGRDRLVEVPTVDPFATEADAVSLALLDGRTEAPEVPWAHSRSVARLLAQWRAGLDAAPRG
ncbi:gfo/Idh/MocA family oxidoreductase [Cryobacterium zongtaii]|uniref:Gfo/Idh/MocA family oxidoreductase n=1 Tax=Cryobacterium zongtaii TaxID=1259217 RepID=A0A2S3ZN81_9MICO|nr:Gfo/Idh/MocA family oxidoreductase [Cryobacterium zongtaii]POH70293.1 gfo/Idh/MocA family oxidoreductase [Cryobacterium zongtaii]